MKILAQIDASYSIGGFEETVKQEGHRWIWWDESHTPAFDVFDEINPQIVFYNKMTRALQACIDEFKPVLVKTTQKHPFDFHVYMPSRINGQYNKHEELLITFPALVDHLRFFPGDADPALVCEVAVVCKLHPSVLKVCRYQPNMKIIHETPWPIYQYLGIGTITDKANLYRSCRAAIVDNEIEAARAISCMRTPNVYSTISNNLVPTIRDAEDINPKPIEYNQLYTYSRVFKSILENIR